MSAIKFGESLSKFMIPIALLEKFGSLTFITGIEISHMNRHSSKPNKLRNVNPIRGRTGSSVEGTRGSLWRTTNMPSLAIDASERYLFTSLMLVVFLEGQVPCFKWACVLRKSGQSVCMANQADLVVKSKQVWLSMIS